MPKHKWFIRSHKERLTAGQSAISPSYSYANSGFRATVQMRLQLDIYPQKFWAVAQLLPAVSACESQPADPQRQFSVMRRQSRKGKDACLVGVFLCYYFLSSLRDHF